MANGAFDLESSTIGSIMGPARSAGLTQPSLGPGMMTGQMSPLSETTEPMTPAPGMSMMPPEPSPAAPEKQGFLGRVGEAWQEFIAPAPEPVEGQPEVARPEFSNEEIFKTGGLLGMAFGLSPAQENYLRQNKELKARYEDMSNVRNGINGAIAALNAGDQKQFDAISGELRIRTAGSDHPIDPAMLQSMAKTKMAMQNVMAKAAPYLQSQIDDGNVMVTGMNPESGFISTIVNPMLQAKGDDASKFNAVTNNYMDTLKSAGDSITNIVAAPKMDEQQRSTNIKQMKSTVTEIGTIYFSTVAASQPQIWQQWLNQYGKDAGTNASDPAAPAKLGVYMADRMSRDALAGNVGKDGFWQSVLNWGNENISLPSFAKPKPPESVEDARNRMKGLLNKPTKG